MFQTYLISCRAAKCISSKRFFWRISTWDSSILIGSFLSCVYSFRFATQREAKGIYQSPLSVVSPPLLVCNSYHLPSSKFPPLSRWPEAFGLLPYLIFVADAVDTIRGEFFVMRRNLRWQNRHTILAWYLFWWDLPCFVAKSVFMVI